MTMAAEPESEGIQVPSDISWQATASCRAWDSAIWFDQHLDGSYANETKAKAICRECPVRSECHDYSLYITAFMVKSRRSQDDLGIFAAMTPDERRKRLRTARREGVTLRYEP